MPFISVIIPNFNHALFLQQRIESVLQQTYTDFEVIILDDHSSDNSIALIEQYRNHEKVSHILFNEENSGSLLLQWKKGINLAGGTWIWIAESDDFADPAFLDECISASNKSPSAGLWYCDSSILDEAAKQIRGRVSGRKNLIFNTNRWNTCYSKNGVTEINEYLKFDCTVNNMSAMVFKKDLAIQLLQTPVSYKYYGDWYFCLGLCLLADICYTPKPLNTYRLHARSFLAAETSLLTSKKEYFEILKLLYHHKQVSNKTYLVNHFAFNYLSFGIIRDGLKNGISIIKNYFASDKKLALKVLIRIAGIRFFYSHYKAKYAIKDKPAAHANS